LLNLITSPGAGGLTLRCGRLQFGDLIDLGREQLREAYMDSFARIMGA